MESVEDSKPSTILTYCTYVPHQTLITSSSRKPSREVGMLRNKREIMSIPGNLFDRQHPRRDPEELHNDSRILAMSLAIRMPLESRTLWRREWLKRFQWNMTGRRRGGSKRRKRRMEEERCREERNVQHQRTQQPIFHAGHACTRKSDSGTTTRETA